MDGRGTPFIDVTGNLKTNGTTRIDASGNLSNIASISNVSMTATGNVQALNFATLSGNVSNQFGSSQIRFGYAGNTYYQQAIKTRHNSGAGAGNAIDFFLWDSGTDAIGDVGTLRIASIETGKGIDIVDGGLQIGGSTVVTSLRNLTNIGTISSGAITSSGNIVNTGTIQATHSATISAQTNMQLALRDADSTNMRANFMVEANTNTNRGGLAIQATEAGVTNDRDLYLQPHGGRVGILTSSPQYSLHVNGATYIDGSLRVTTTGNTDTDFFVNNHSASGQGGVHIYGVDNNHSIYLRRGYDGALNTTDFHQYGGYRFYTNGALANQTEKLRIASNGTTSMFAGTNNTLLLNTSSGTTGTNGYIRAYSNSTIGSTGDVRIEVYANGNDQNSNNS